MTVKPMLAVAATEAQIEQHLPMIASPKIDGIRCTIQDGVALSRSLKPLPNKHVQAMIGQLYLNGLDGEITVGDPTAPDVYRSTVKAVMKIEGEPQFTFWVFDDCLSKKTKYIKRRLDATKKMKLSPHIELLDMRLLSSKVSLLGYEEEILNLGYEGLILRTPESPYKQGRSTLNQGYLLKLKRFTDSEAVVVGTTELLHNDNEATTNELGRTARSSHKEHKRPAGTLGALICKDLKSDIQFRVGTGLDAETRSMLWNDSTVIGKIIKYKSFQIGVKDAPRHPVFLGFRDSMDM